MLCCGVVSRDTLVLWCFVFLSVEGALVCCVFLSVGGVLVCCVSVGGAVVWCVVLSVEGALVCCVFSGSAVIGFQWQMPLRSSVNSVFGLHLVNIAVFVGDCVSVSDLCGDSGFWPLRVSCW